MFRAEDPQGHGDDTAGNDAVMYFNMGTWGQKFMSPVEPYSYKSFINGLQIQTQVEADYEVDHFGEHVTRH